MSRQCFVFYRDNIVTKGPLSWPRRSRQEVRVATGAWLRPRNFGSGQEICRIATGFHGVVSRQRNSMSRHSWSGRDDFLLQWRIFRS